MLPTPLASDHKGQSSSGRHRKGHGGPRLTATLAAERGFLPTPTARAYSYNQGGAAGRVGPVRPSIDTLAKKAGLGGYLLILREWLMGFPIGWTASAPLEMRRFQQWFASHGRR